MLKRNPESIEGEVFAFCGRDVVLRKDGAPLTHNDLRLLSQGAGSGDVWCEPDTGIGWLTTSSYAAAATAKSAEATALPEGYTAVPLRSYACNFDTEGEHYRRLFRAKGMAGWTAETRHCARCGARLEPHASLSALSCTECGKIVFPRIEPCVIVLVSKGDKMMLARHSQRNTNIYACIAGFMETGETAEQAVRREIMEETGITVKNIRYFGTQSWPFPSQLMIAFTAEWESGEPRPQDGELDDVRWFAPGECPDTPQPGSIAYRMIQSFGTR